MEEWVGSWWHRAITRAADRRHPEAAVSLGEMQRAIALLFHAAGGAAGVRVSPASAQRHGGARGWLERVAGSGLRAALPVLEPEVLALPPEIAVFAARGLNRDLYLWLAALAAEWRGDEAAAQGWIAANRAATHRVLSRWPGLAARHARLAQATLAQRPAPERLRGPAREAEAAVQQALRASLGSDGAQAVCTPSSPTKAPPVARGRAANPAPTARVPRGPAVTDVAPVWLWLQPGTPAGDPATVRPDPAAASDTGHRPPPGDDKRRRARRVQEASEREAMLMFFRAESLLTWGEFIQVNRASDDDENDDALTAADDMDELAVAPDGEACAARVRFDLDLPSAAEDDRPLGEGIALPEWDWRAGVLRPGHCRAQLMEPRDPAPFVPDAALHRLAARTRRRMELLRAAPRWRHAQRDGDELDLDAFVRLAAEATHDDAPPVLSQRVKQDRSLAVLLLADLSLSTDAWVPGGPGSGAGTGRGAGDASHVPAPRVIDVIREAMQLVGHALAASGDAFEMLGFSSVRRQQVRIQRLKDFDERWGPRPQARIGAIRPGYYTRMGAALRVATERLGRRPERQRLLLLLTDGKPNDLDVYEGRYGLEDTRHAVQAARAAGLVPFAVTIDPEGHDWLPYLFGRPHYALLHQPQQLATRLAQVVGALARQAG